MCVCICLKKAHFITSILISIVFYMEVNVKNSQVTELGSGKCELNYMLWGSVPEKVCSDLESFQFVLSSVCVLSPILLQTPKQQIWFEQH